METKEVSTFSLGHMINHSREKENVTPLDFDFPNSFPQKVKRVVPIVSFSKQDSCIAKGIVFVALRDLEDEELFFNYHFSKSEEKQVPEWY